MIKGFDISENNGSVNMLQAKAEGMEFVIIRLGYGNCHLDSKFYENINNAIYAGLKIGVYYYDYGLNAKDAKREAQFLVRILLESGLTPDKLDLGVWFDMEDADNWKRKHGMPKAHTITEMCSAFICECNKWGYWCGIYASYDWLKNKINTEQLASYVPYWCAQWDDKCDWENTLLWQYTDSLEINGQLFDGDILMKKLPVDKY